MLGELRAAAGGQELKRTARLLPVWALLALGGCGGAPQTADQPARAAVRPVSPGAVHVVRPGETLFAIARRYGLDHRDLARWNQLGDGSMIRVGQRLRLQAAAGATDSGAVVRRLAPPPQSGWHWPVPGEVLGRFGQSPRTASGMLIGGRLGEPVLAAADGEVVYAGSGLTGYGQLVIVRHTTSWLSAYGHNEQLLVREGARVRAGEPIARMGEAPGRRAALHFEIRHEGEPVDPLEYLPRRR